MDHQLFAAVDARGIPIEDYLFVGPHRVGFLPRIPKPVGSLNLRSHSPPMEEREGSDYDGAHETNAQADRRDDEKPSPSFSRRFNRVLELRPSLLRHGPK